MTPQGDGHGPFARTIEGRIKWAREFFCLHRDLIRVDRDISRLAVDFEAAHRATRQATCRAGIASLCTVCDRDQGGSCCGAGIELKYDGWMLLVNLVFGIELPESRARLGSCFFLGETGCILAAREVLCINYLCPTVIETVPFSKIFALRELEGREIEILFRLNERIKRVVRDRASAVTRSTPNGPSL